MNEIALTLKRAACVALFLASASYAASEWGLPILAALDPDAHRQIEAYFPQASGR